MEDKEQIEAKTEKPKRGRGGTNNFPQTKPTVETDEDKALVKKLLNEALSAYRQERVKSDKELAERLDKYFTDCAENGVIPTIEEMCLCTGYSYWTCYDWEVGKNKGFSEQTSQIIKKAKEFMKTFDAKMVVAGKLNFLAYCFRAKNYYGMVDKQEYTIAPKADSMMQLSPEEIQAKYLTSGRDLPTLGEGKASDFEEK